MENILGTNVVTQIAILVNDIEKTGHDYAKFLGVDYPGYSVTSEYEEALTTYYGEKSDARAKLMFFNINKNLSLELIEPDNNPSTWRDDLNKYGECVHHIAFNVNGLKTIIPALKKEGMELVQTGEYTGGRYAYIDARDKLKLMLELLEND